jgi:hypothetical protein
MPRGRAAAREKLVDGATPKASQLDAMNPGQPLQQFHKSDHSLSDRTEGTVVSRRDPNLYANPPQVGEDAGLPLAQDGLPRGEGSLLDKVRRGDGTPRWDALGNRWLYRSGTCSRRRAQASPPRGTVGRCGAAGQTVSGEIDPPNDRGVV